ncbi:protein OS-9-like [Haliotis rufescens]|uniref:protein OS-9-like n=1 Tax=Haliotis rufescens TaxID=6454 RepID=UPI00201EF157|nr:protein OS-9-like [Haliotis rufescens]
MATKTNRLLRVCCLLVLFLAQSKSFLDFEELKSTHYGIDIVNEPVKMGQEVPGSVVQLSSKFGQAYQCSFPNQVEQEKQKEEEEKLALETGILQLLKPFSTQGCLFKTKDWWSYEFCYGKYIRQMHIEDGNVKGEVIYLGHYESDFDWDNDTLKDQRLRSRTIHSKYHSQNYTNGTKCDLTEAGRRAEVRFFCEEGTSDYIARIDEPETCVYIVTIYTSHICNHPYLKPPTPKNPVPITCNPVVSEEQYREYLADAEAEKEKKQLAQMAREAEAATAAAAARAVADSVDDKTELEPTETATSIETGIEAPPSDPAEPVIDEETTDMDSIFGPSVESLMKKTLSNEMKNLAGQSTDKPIDVKLSFKVVRNPKDIDNFIKDTFGQEGDEGAMDSGPASEAATPRDGPSDLDLDPDHGVEEDLKHETHPVEDGPPEDVAEDEDVTVDAEEEELMDEFDKELGNLKTAYRNKRNKFANMKNKVRDSVKLQFDEIIDEAEEMYGEEIDKKLAFKQLAGTLDKLITKLEHTEKEIDNVDRELEQFNKKTMTSKSGGTPNIQKPKGPGSLTPTTSKDTPGTKGDVADDDRVKVRVTRVKAGDTVKDGTDVPDEQKQQLEQTVKDELIKAGLDTGGGKIQVKIITTGYYDNEDDSIHILSQEDTSNFQNMIVAILGGTNEASKEAARQQQLEDNYNNVWGQGKSKKSKSSIIDKGQ